MRRLLRSIAISCVAVGVALSSLTTDHWPLTTDVWAAVPWVINYQGRLTDSNGTPTIGSYTMTFRIYDDSTSGTKQWQEQQTISLTTTDNGIFNVILGAVTSLSAVDFNSSLWLSVQVADDTEMTPRQRLTSVGYAMNTAELGGLDSTKFMRTDVDTSTSGKLTITRSGTALLIKPTTDPASGTKVLDVQNAAGTSNFSVDMAGNVAVAGNLSVTGTMSGSTSTTGTTSTSWNIGSGTSATSNNISLLFGQTSGQKSIAFKGASTSDFAFSDPIRLSTQSALRLEGATAGGSYVALKAPSSPTTYTLTLPAAVGSAGQVLSTDASGNLSWANDANSGGTITGVTAGTGLTGGGTSGTVTLSLSTPVSVANGGTGASTLTSNGVLLGNGTSAISATTAGSANQVLRVPAAGGAPAFGAIDMSSSSAVTGALGTTNGGTSQSTYTTGDILYASAANTLSKLTIGSSGQFLKVGSGVPAWATISNSDVSGLGTMATQNANNVAITGGAIDGTTIGATTAAAGTLTNLTTTGTTTLGNGTGDVTIKTKTYVQNPAAGALFIAQDPTAANSDGYIALGRRSAKTGGWNVLQGRASDGHLIWNGSQVEVQGDSPASFTIGKGASKISLTYDPGTDAIRFSRGTFAQQFRNLVKNGSFEAFSALETFVASTAPLGAGGAGFTYQGGWSNFSPDEWSWDAGKVYQNAPVLFTPGTSVTATTLQTEAYDGKSSVTLEDTNIAATNGPYNATTDAAASYSSPYTDAHIEQTITGLKPSTVYAVGGYLRTLSTTAEAILDITGEDATTSTTLSGGTLAIGDTKMTVSSVANFPDNGIVIVDSERILYSGKDATAGQLTGLERGFEATTEATHASGAAVTIAPFKHLTTGTGAVTNFTLYKEQFVTTAKADDVKIHLICAGTTGGDQCRFDGVQIVEGRSVPQFQPGSIVDTGDQTIYGAVRLGRTSDGRGGVLAVDKALRTRSVEFFGKDPGLSGTAGGFGGVGSATKTGSGAGSTITMTTSGLFTGANPRDMLVLITATSPQTFKWQYRECSPSTGCTGAYVDGGTGLLVSNYTSATALPGSFGIQVAFANTSTVTTSDQWQFFVAGMNMAQQYNSYSGTTTYQPGQTRIYQDPVSNQLTFQDGTTVATLSQIVGAGVASPARVDPSTFFPASTGGGQMTLSTSQGYTGTAQVTFDVQICADGSGATRDSYQWRDNILNGSNTAASDWDIACTQIPASGGPTAALPIPGGGGSTYGLTLTFGSPAGTWQDGNLNDRWQVKAYPAVTSATVKTSDVGTVTSTMIANGAVTGPKIAMGSDAKGDVLVHNGTNYVRLPVGSNGLGLLADSTTATGVKWSAVGSGNGTVTSVGLAAPAEFTVSGSPVTTSGTLTLTKATQSANLIYAGPSSGAAAAPSFRALVDADVPDDLTVTSTKAGSFKPTSDVVPLTLQRGTDTSPAANLLTIRNAANAADLFTVSAAGAITAGSVSSTGSFFPGNGAIQTSVGIGYDPSTGELMLGATRLGSTLNMGNQALIGVNAINAAGGAASWALRNSSSNAKFRFDFTTNGGLWIGGPLWDGSPAEVLDIAGANSNMTFSGSGTHAIKHGGTTLLSLATTSPHVTVSGDLLTPIGSYLSPYGGIGRYQNLALQSEVLDNATWADATATAVTVSANLAAANPAPNGTTTADRLTQATSTIGAGRKQDINVTTAAGGRTFTLSVWLKAATLHTARLQLKTATNTQTAQNVSVTTSWQRFSDTYAVPAGDTNTTLTAVIDLDDNITYNSLDVWGAQLEEASTPGVYVRTTTAAIAASQGAVTDGVATGTTSGTVTSITAGTGLTGGTITTSGTIALSSPVSLANGGTAASLTASNGGILYSTATAGAILAGTATANKVLMSGASAAPVWSTPTYPNASATAGTYLKSDGTNFIASTGSAAGTGSCTNQFVTAENTDAAPTCTTATLASAQFANQGTTITLLHGNGAGNPTWSPVSLTADVTGTLPIANGGTNNSAAYTAGSVVFSNGTSLTQNNANLFWDNTNSRLGIGTAAPSGKLTVINNGTNGIMLLGGAVGAQVDLVLGRNTAADARFSVAGASGQYDVAAVAGDAILRTEGGALRVSTNAGVGTSALTILGSNGNIGIGTASPGSVGAAKLELNGANTSTAGPHIQAVTGADTYPLFQSLNWAHNNVSSNFDAYFDGFSWRSAYSGSNFQIYKVNDTLQFNYDSGKAQGALLSWKRGIVMDASGNVGLGLGTSLTPQATLDVRGDILTPTGSVMSPYGGIGRFQNLLLRSEEFNDATWVKTNVSAITADGVTAPDGTATAEALSPASAATTTVKQTSGTTAAASTAYTFSVWGKVPSGTQNIVLTVGDGATSNPATVALTTSWQRFSVSYTASGTPSGSVFVQVGDATWTSGTIDLWGAQVESGVSTPGVYAKTSTVAMLQPRQGFSGAYAFPNSDVNRDGYVNFLDLNLVAAANGCASSQACWNSVVGVDNMGNALRKRDMDLNGDGTVNSTDLSIVAGNSIQWSGVTLNGTTTVSTLTVSGTITAGSGANQITTATGLLDATKLSGTVPVANGGTNLTSAANNNVMVGNGATWQSKALPACTDSSGNHLNYDASSNTFSCGTSSSGGTVTSVALAAPAEFTVSGSPVTTSGTLTFTKANQTANLIYAGPSSGAAAAPTFRALVSNDIPQAANYTWTGQQDFTGAALLGASPLRFEGATVNSIYTILAITDPTTTSKTITFPDLTGTAALMFTTTTPLASSGIGAIISNPADYNMGYRFRPTTNGVITALGGRWDTGARTVRLYSCPTPPACSDGVDISGGGVSVTSTGTFAYTNLGHPISVTAGTSYVVAERTGAGNYAYTAFTTPVTTGGITIDSTQYVPASDLVPTTFSVTTFMYGQADVKFEPSNTNDLTVAGNVTVNGQIAATGSNPFSGRSGASGSYATIALGRTSTDSQWAVAAAAGSFATDAAAGDIILREEDSTKALRLLSGTGASALIINSTSPQVTVGGDLKATGTITAGSGANVITTAAGLLDATKLTGAVPTASLGNAVQLQGSTPGTQQTGNLNVSGAGIFGSNLTATGTITASGVVNNRITFATDTNLYRSAANILKTDGSLIVVGTITAGSGANVITTAAGLLDATKLSGTVPIANGGTNNATAYTAGSVIFANGTSLTQNNANLFWDNTNNRLGIGTTAPSDKLHVVATGNFIVSNFACGGSFAGVGFSTTVTGCTTYSLLGEGSNTLLNAPSGGSIFLRIGNVDKMTLDSTGKVGIGTTSPQATLDVRGDVLTPTGSYLSPYGGIGRFQNLLLRSEEFDNATWVKTNVAAITADTVTAPDGTVTAEALTPAAAAATNVKQTSGTTAAASTAYTFSVWGQVPSGTKSIVLTVGDGATTNPTTVTFTTSWQRFSVTYTSSGTPSGSVFVQVGDATWTAGTIDLWGAQLESGVSTPGVYAKTSTAAMAQPRRGFSGAYAFPLGDVNRDGYVNFLDFNLILAATGCDSSQACWNSVVGVDNMGNAIRTRELDLNGDGAITLSDVLVATGNTIQWSGVTLNGTTTVSTLTVNGTTTLQNVTIAAHLGVSQTTAPTVSVASCGTGAPSITLTSGSTDIAGGFSVTAGTTPGNCAVTLTFNQAYNPAPKMIHVSPTNSTAPARNMYISSRSTTTFVATMATAPSAGGEVDSWDYLVIQ